MRILIDAGLDTSRVRTAYDKFRSRFTTMLRKPNKAAFETADILDAWQHLPAAVLRPERNKRAHLSSVLSRNEVARDYAYSRKLFQRIAQGWYQFNPQLGVRRGTREEDGEAWQPIFGALNLPLIGDFVHMDAYRPLQALAQAAGVAVAELPLLKAGRILQARKALQAQQEAMRRREAEHQAPAAASQHPAARPAEPAPWGTPRARALEIERIRAEIAARHAPKPTEKK